MAARKRNLIRPRRSAWSSGGIINTKEPSTTAGRPSSARSRRSPPCRTRATGITTKMAICTT